MPSKSKNHQIVFFGCGVLWLRHCPSRFKGPHHWGMLPSSPLQRLARCNCNLLGGEGHGGGHHHFIFHLPQLHFEGLDCHRATLAMMCSWGHTGDDLQLCLVQRRLFSPGVRTACRGLCCTSTRTIVYHSVRMRTSAV